MTEVAIGLRERAAAALAEYLREEEARQEAELEADLVRQVEGITEGLAELEVANEAIRFERRGNQVVGCVEGLEFTGRRAYVGYRYRGEVSLLGTCPRCGETVFSGEISGLPQLAELLQEFTPHYSHRCGTELPAPRALSTEARLLEVLRQFICENAPRPAEPE